MKTIVVMLYREVTLLSGEHLEQANYSNPYCTKCDDIATVVDHIIPHKGDMVLFWNTGNWQSMCKRCHERKTVNEMEDLAINKYPW